MYNPKLNCVIIPLNTNKKKSFPTDDTLKKRHFLADEDRKKVHKMIKYMEKKSRREKKLKLLFARYDINNINSRMIEEVQKINTFFA